MSKRQTTVWLDRKTKERLRAEAVSRGGNMSQLAKLLIEEGLTRLEDGNGTFPRPILEEILVAIFSIEETVFRGFLDPKVTPNADKKTKKKLLDEVESVARKKMRELIDGGDK
jgi:hypothetical protein